MNNVKHHKTWRLPDGSYIRGGAKIATTKWVCKEDCKACADNKKSQESIN